MIRFISKYAFLACSAVLLVSCSSNKKPAAPVVADKPVETIVEKNDFLKFFESQHDFRVQNAAQIKDVEQTLSKAKTKKEQIAAINKVIAMNKLSKDYQSKLTFDDSLFEKMKELNIKAEDLNIAVAQTNIKVLSRKDGKPTAALKKEFDGYQKQFAELDKEMQVVVEQVETKYKDTIDRINKAAAEQKKAPAKNIK